jgi:hypothetical protein
MQFSCLVCLKPYETPEIFSLLIRLTEAGSMREVMVCRGCAEAIASAVASSAAGDEEGNQDAD